MLPSPGDLFLEIETAKKHGGWSVWKSLPTVEKAQLLAHELHVKMREHYEYDVRLPAADREPKGESASPLSAMRERFLNGGKNLHA